MINNHAGYETQGVEKEFEEELPTNSRCRFPFRTFETVLRGSI